MTSDEAFKEWWKPGTSGLSETMAEKGFRAGHASRDEELATLRSAVERLQRERDMAYKELETKWRTAFKAMDNHPAKDDGKCPECGDKNFGDFVTGKQRVPFCEKCQYIGTGLKQ